MRVYPDGNNPHQSFSKINFYLSPELAAISDDETQNEKYETAKERMQGFASIIQMEDYVAAASAHQGILSGAQE